VAMHGHSFWPASRAALPRCRKIASPRCGTAQAAQLKSSASAVVSACMAPP
jgi:hypothetical protein